MSHIFLSRHSSKKIGKVEAVDTFFCFWKKTATFLLYSHPLIRYFFSVIQAELGKTKIALMFKTS